MKTNIQIRDKCSQLLTIIIECSRGCRNKPPGFYCSTCYTMWCRFEELEWVLEQEGKLKKEMNRAVFDKS